jgi:hypothetical protein
MLNLYTFGVTYTINNHQIYIKYVTDAWTPVFYKYHLTVILSYFLNILTPIICILLRLTKRIYTLPSTE